jgi:C4-dicarboxylate-specific signal transduction histidine kinase
MNRNLTKLCFQECLRHLQEISHSPHWKILLHTLKANVHALGLVKLAYEIDHWENRNVSPKDLPIEAWLKQIKSLDLEERSWNETFQTMAQEAGKNLIVHWHGPKLEDLSSIMIHLVRNTLAHGQTAELNFWVEVRQRGQDWFVQVKDNGGGFQKHQRAKDIFAGQGKGLEYVRETLKSWGGRFGILSSPGVGLTITLSFPIAQQNPTKKAG